MKIIHWLTTQTFVVQYIQNLITLETESENDKNYNLHMSFNFYF